MALNIKTASDPVEIGTLITLIYGQPGIGKTSLAFSADKPLLLDFDAGAHRSGYRKDYVPVKDWKEIASISADDLAGYNTVIIDTLGACLDRLAEHVMASDGKARNRATGGLSLPGFGALKAQFIAWIKRLKSAGCDVVMLAHGKEKNENDRTYIRPDIVGSSYDEIMKIADFVGYYYMEQAQGKNERILDFNPNPNWIGKNSAGFPPLAVPHLSQHPDYLAGKLAEARSLLTRESEMQRRAVAILNTWRTRIDEAESAEDINTIIADLRESPEGDTLDKQIKHLIHNRAKAMTLTYSQEAGQYIGAAA